MAKVELKENNENDENTNVDELTDVGQLLVCAADGASCGRPTKGPVVALPDQVPLHAVPQAPGPNIGRAGHALLPPLLGAMQK